MPTLRDASMYKQDHKPDYETGKLKKGNFEKTSDVRRREREARMKRSSFGRSTRAQDPNFREKVITDKAGRTRTVYVSRHSKVKAPKRPRKTAM